MKRAIEFLMLFYFLFIITNNSSAQSYSINIEITGIKDTSVILGYYSQSKMFVNDTIQVDSKGKGEFTGKEALPQGIYLIYMPNQTYFDFLLGNDQSFTLKTTSPDYINNLTITGSEESAKFLNYQRFLLTKQTEAKKIQDQLEKVKEKPDSLKLLQTQLQQLTEEVKNNANDLISNNPQTLLAMFLKGLQNIEVPEFKAEENNPKADSIIQTKRYYYYKNHYFDNIDLTDERLLRTPFFHGKLESYFNQTVIQHPDTLTSEAIKLIEKSRPNETMFRYMVQHFFNYANDSKMMGMDAMMVAIGEKYYLSKQASWAEEEFLKKLEERIIKIKPNLIGKTAHDMKLESISGEFFKLSEINAPYTILAFWEPSCGHCKKEIPALYKTVWEKYKDKGIKVFAVYTQVEREEWTKFVETNNITEWINVYDRYQQSGFRDYYDIYSTPVIYILDRDKKIIAKRIGVENIPGFLDNEIKQGRL